MGFASEQHVRLTGGPVTYYTQYDTTNLYVEKAFSGNVNTITVTNDHDTDPVQISYDGASLDGEINPGESISLNVSTKTSVYIKSTGGSASGKSGVIT